MSETWPMSEETSVPPEGREWQLADVLRAATPPSDTGSGR